MKKLANITVVAPDRDQSGTGTSMTLRNVVRLHEKPHNDPKVKVYSVEGTPADCVILACEKLMNSSPDLIVSGINLGANLGFDVMLSGTVGAAIHGYLRNIPSIAISAAYKKEVRYDVAGEIIEELVENLFNDNTSKLFLLNVNVPCVQKNDIKSIKLTSLGNTNYMQNVEEEKSGIRTHYWIKPDRKNTSKPDAKSDILAIEENNISITAIKPNFDDSIDNSSFSNLIDSVKQNVFN